MKKYCKVIRVFILLLFHDNIVCRNSFRVMDDAQFLKAANELADYGIKLNQEDASFISKLASITRKYTFPQHSFSEYFTCLAAIEDGDEIEKHVDVLTATISALNYRLRLKNAAALEFRNEIEPLHPLIMKVEKEKKKENRIIPDDSSNSI